MDESTSWSKLASSDIVAKTAQTLQANGIEPIIVNTGAEALTTIKELIPAGASVMNGSSVTLEQIGYIDYMKAGQHGWNNLHGAMLAESDPAKKKALRLQAELSEYYLGSVHALTEQGEFVVASNTGSQLPHIVFTSPNLILVVSTKKIVPTLAAALERLERHVIPLEDQHMQQLYNVHTSDSKVVIFKRENVRYGRKVRMILIKEDLGF